MSKKGKTICKWKKNEIEENLPELVKMVGNPKFICGNCGRAAAKKKWLCKPVPLKKDR